MIGCPLARATVLLLLLTASIVGVQSPADAEGPSLADSFSRADNWQIGSAETGQAWQLWNGTAVVADQAGAASIPGYTLAVADAGYSAGTVAASVSVVSDEFWLVFRASNSGNYWRFGRWQGGPYQLQQVAGWALGSPVITTSASVVAVNGDRLSCTLDVGVACSVNGEPVASSSAPFNRTSTTVGFAMADPSAPPPTRIDDVMFTPAAPAPDLAVAVDAASASVTAGASASWSVTITNIGGARAAGVSLAATVPSSLSQVSHTSSSGTCTVGSSVSCEFGELLMGQSVTVQVTGTAPATPQAMMLSAAATTTSPESALANNGDSAAISVEPGASPSSVVTDNFARPDSYSLGTTPTGHVWQGWNGTPRVVGQQAASGEPSYMLAAVDGGISSGSVQVTVPVVSGDFWLMARGSNNGNYWRFGSSGGGNYVLEQVRNWSMASPEVQVLAAVAPAPGDRLECRYLTGIACSVNGVDVAASTDSFNNTATWVGMASYSSSVPATPRFDNFSVSLVSASSDLAVAVAPGAGSVLAGDAMVWTATVTNIGAASAGGVQVSTSLPPGVSALEATPSTGSCSLAAGVATCSLGAMAPAGVGTVTYRAIAPSTSGSVGLTVVVAPSAGSDPDPSNNQASASIQVRLLALPGEVLLDQFERPDAVTLGQVPGGRSWDQVYGTIGVAGGRAGKTSSQSGLAMAAIDPGFTFGTMEVTVASGSSEQFYLVFRAKDAANYFRFGRDSSGFYRVQKLINNSLTGLEFNAIRVNVVPADGDRIRLVTRPDDSWFISVNGVHVVDGGDLSLLGEFRYGLAANSDAVRFDDVRISPLMSTGTATAESFNHPEGSNLELRPPTSGTAYVWLTPLGYWQTLSGRAVMGSPGYGLAWMETSSELASVGARVVNAGNEAWLVFRRMEDGSYFRFGYSADSQQQYTLERITSANAKGVIPGGVTTSGQVRAAGDQVEIRQSPDGTIRGFVNGVEAVTAVDAVNGIRGTGYGLAGPQGVTFDDFSVTPQ